MQRRVYLTTEEVAAKTQVSQRQILNLIANGFLPSKKAGRMHFIRPSDVKKVKHRPSPGRPRKGKAIARPKSH
jgi:excisionase family DNA binding protein